MATKKKAAASKKASAKKTSKKVAKKSAKKSAKNKSGTKPRTQGEIKALVKEAADLTPKQTRAVFETLQTLVVDDLRERGKIVIPGLARFVRKERPARPARKGRNPFTGEETTFKAKPATTVAKVYPVRVLKDAVAGVVKEKKTRKKSGKKTARKKK